MNNVNAPITQLYRCLLALKLKNKISFIPYKESKLTQILLPSLVVSGLSGVAIVLCVSSHMDDNDDTLSVLGQTSILDEHKEIIAGTRTT